MGCTARIRFSHNVPDREPLWLWGRHNASGAWVGKREIARRCDVCARTIDHWLSRGMPHFQPSARMDGALLDPGLRRMVPPTVRSPWDRQAVTRAILPRGKSLTGRNEKLSGQARKLNYRRTRSRANLPSCRLLASNRSNVWRSRPGWTV